MSNAFGFEFFHWYIAAFEVLFGAAMILRTDRFMNPKRMFRRELKDPLVSARFSAALERRRSIEAMSKTPWRFSGTVTLVLGGITALGTVQPIVSYALFCLLVSLVAGVVFLGLRNRSDRRAASLAPRTPISVVPWWLYVVASANAITPLTLVINRNVTLSAVVVFIVSVILIGVATVVSGMAAILSGEDPEIELAVEHRVRCHRVATPLLLSIVVPFVLFAWSGVLVSGHLALLQLGAWLFCVASYLTTFGWWMVCLFGQPKPREGVHAF